MSDIKPDLSRTVLAVMAVLLLIAASLWILQPFLGALVWATMIVVATWPLLLRLQARFGGRRSPAVAVLVTVLLLLLFVPLLIAAGMVIEHVDTLPTLAERLSHMQPPAPPSWLAGLPLVGESLLRLWQEVAVAGSAALFTSLKPYVGLALKWLAAKAGSLGGVIVQFLLTGVLAAILYSQGEAAALWVRRFCRRLAGERGNQIVTLAGQAIRSVAMGIVITALVQTVLGAIGLWLCGVPYAALLGTLILLCCLVQLGPLLIMLPAAGWLFWSGNTGWAITLTIWAVVVGMLDSVLRPWLIRQGADLPLLLIFAGVIGGLFAFGLIGLFVGPVLLAVTYTLLQAWIAEAEATPDSSS